MNEKPEIKTAFIKAGNIAPWFKDVHEKCDGVAIFAFTPHRYDVSSVGVGQEAVVVEYMIVYREITQPKQGRLDVPIFLPPNGSGVPR